MSEVTTLAGPELHYKTVNLGASGYSIVEIATGAVVVKNVGDLASVKTAMVLLEVNWRLYAIEKLQVEIETLQATTHKPIV